jgi:hypothetical protein
MASNRSNLRRVGHVAAGLAGLSWIAGAIGLAVLVTSGPLAWLAGGTAGFLAVLASLALLIPRQARGSLWRDARPATAPLRVVSVRLSPPQSPPQSPGLPLSGRVLPARQDGSELPVTARPALRPGLR